MLRPTGCQDGRAGGWAPLLIQEGDGAVSDGGGYRIQEGSGASRQGVVTGRYFPIPNP